MNRDVLTRILNRHTRTPAMAASARPVPDLPAVAMEAASSLRVDPVTLGIRAHSPTPLVCYFCRGRRFWRSVYGPTICAACYPPAAARLVAGWILHDDAEKACTEGGSAA